MLLHGFMQRIPMLIMRCDFAPLTHYTKCKPTRACIMRHATNDFVHASPAAWMMTLRNV